MKGTTAECLADYARHSSGVELSKFVGCAPATAADWLAGTTMPTGEKLLRLRVYLALKGYDVTEFAETPPPAQELSTLIALNVLGLDEAQAQLGYTTVQQLYRFLFGRSAAVRDRIWRLEKLLEEKKSDLQEALLNWEEVDGKAVPDSRPSEKLARAQESQPISRVEATGAQVVAVPGSPDTAVLVKLAEAFALLVGSTKERAVIGALRDNLSEGDLRSIRSVVSEALLG